MRKSQYLTWNKEMLLSYIQDFEEANKRGWNLVTEKYAWMMESTSPTQFEELKASLPKLEEEKKAIIEGIVAIQVEWMEEFAKEYPKMAEQARSIHTYEDTEYNTSYETYLRGEMRTYSEQTLYLYGQFIVGLAQAKENLAKKIMSNTAMLYGYDSLEEAERRL